MINGLFSLFDKVCISSDFFLSIFIWSNTKDFSAIISACKSSVLACIKLLEFCEALWWSGDGFVDFVVIGVSLGEINGFSVLRIGMEIVGV